MSGDVAEDDRAQDSGSLPPLVPPPLDPRFGQDYAQQPVQQQQVPQQQMPPPTPQPQPQPPMMQQQPVQQPPVQQQAVPMQQPMPPRPAPQQPQPQQQPQFPMARVFDGINPNGGPTVNRQRLDPREVPALVAYLTQATVALAAPGTTRDEVVPSAPPEV